MYIFSNINSLPDYKAVTENPIRTTRFASITTPIPSRKNDKFGASKEDDLEVTSTRNNDKFFNSEEVDKLIADKNGGLPWPFTVSRTEVYVPNGPTVLVTPFQSSGKI